mgnify:CR=1 FL=1
MENLVIEKADKQSINTIVDFQIKMAYETENMELDKNTVFKGVKHIFKHPEEGYYMLCRINNDIISTLLVLYEWSDWRNGKVLWIHSVYVLPEWRGNGVFKKMYQELQKLVRNTTRYKGLRLYVEQQNKPALRVYEKLGMTGDHYKLYEWMK